jgi:hypothetical protein
MSDSLPDSEVLGRRVCLGCNPDADPSREILQLYWCTAHEPSTQGEMDAYVNRDRYRLPPPQDRSSRAKGAVRCSRAPRRSA